MDGYVSIPLKSGRFVIKQIIDIIEAISFNPLKIGSVCNAVEKEEARGQYVSIPLKSGRFVIS